MSGYTSLGKKSGNGVGGGGDLNSNAVGPFGTTLTSDMTPIGQAAFVYTVNNTMWTTGSTGVGASITASNGVMTCSSGNSTSGSAFVRLIRNNKYRAGQGSMGRFTAIFNSGAPDALQLAGMFNGESGFWFCVSGSNSFGVLHRESSKREIRSFTITSAPAGAATLVVTLAGDPITIAINGGASANQTSYQISQIDYSNVGRGWTAESIDGVVYFVSNVPGPLGGTFSITNTGVSIATAATVQAGVLPVETFVSQSQWNVDTMDGSGPSRFTLDRTKGNVYGIGYQYLGFGNVSFSVEDPETGLLTKCHMVRRAGSGTSTVVQNPNMSVGWMAINSGSGASSVTVKGASAGSFTEGQVARNVGVGFTIAASKSSVGATEVPVFTIRANRIYSNTCCYGEVTPVNMTVANDAGNASSGKLLKVQVYKNASLGGPVNFAAVDVRSMVAYDTAATSFTTNSRTQLLKSFIVAANNSMDLPLLGEGIFVSSGETLTVTVQRVSSDVDTAAVTLSWFEDQ